MVGILKKGVHDPSCFRRTRSANSVNISNEVHIITASSGPDTSQAEEQTTSYEPVPLQTNSVKILEEEFTSSSSADVSEQLEPHNISEDEDEAASTVDSTQHRAPNSGLALQRSVSETGLETPSTDIQPKDGEEKHEGLYPPATFFPSLPDTVLKTMGLLVSVSSASTDRESFTEDDIENRFTSLSLAFKTDQLTLSTRLELQQRQRDQAECNMSAEVTRLKTAIYKLNHVYVDSESVENLTQIQALVDIFQQATDRVSSSAEMFGAVQQEHRLSLATEVLMAHVENVKRSLEKANIELEEVKRVLAENNIIMEESPDLTDEPAPRTHRYRSLAGIITSNKKVGSKRRASIAALPRPLSSSEALRSVPSPIITSVEPRSRMANVVNAIRRKTSLSPIVSHTSPGLDVHEWSEHVPDTVEEIEEVFESRKESLTEEVVSTCDDSNKVDEDTSKITLLLSDGNLLAIDDIMSSREVCYDNQSTSTQAEVLPRPSQRVMSQMKRIVAQARLKIRAFDQNHRNTVLEKLRIYVAVVLIAVAAWYLMRIIFTSAEATNRRSFKWYTVEEILRPYIKVRRNGPPPT